MKQVNENSCCNMCVFRGELNGDYYNCSKKGKVKPSDICKKYRFDPFSKRPHRQRHFDTSMFDPLDFEI
ncbi:MAG: hypothetical protein ACI3XA_10110 [Clostridia bacterium]